MKLKPLILLSFGLILLAGIYAFTTRPKGEFKPFVSDNEKYSDLLNKSVEDALIELGDEKPIHYIETIDADSARMGEEIVKFGRLKDKSNRRISKYFVCTDCHNLVMESADPSNESPEAVLEYSREKDIPFLPGSTFYGMYNKRHWYNGDYRVKYGDLVRPSKDSLVNAIQLCATQCSQGREMVDWEIRAVLHYYKTISYKIGDLLFAKDEVTKMQNMLKSNDNSGAIKLLKTKYSDINPATFGTSKMPEIEGYNPKAENGEFIYKNGCLHCHAVEKDMTNFDLGVDKLSFKFLMSKLYAYNQFSISHITRYGTYAINGRRQYMPQYSMENMSDEQMLDLIHYIKTKAEE